IGTGLVPRVLRTRPHFLNGNAGSGNAVCDRGSLRDISSAMGTHYKGSKREVQALDTFIKLIRGTESLSARLRSRLDETSLTDSQFSVLEALLHLGPLCLSSLAQKLLKTGGNLT